MNYIWVLIIALYIVLTHIVAKNIGAKRKIGYGKTVFWSLMISPIIMYFVAKSSTLIEEK